MARSTRARPGKFRTIAFENSRMTGLRGKEAGSRGPVPRTPGSGLGKQLDGSCPQSIDAAEHLELALLDRRVENGGG